MRDKMFELASRLKLRFGTVKGRVTVEDLWDMPLTDDDGCSLDDIAKSLNRAIKEDADASFVVQAKKNKCEEENELRFDITKYVISVKLADIEEAENAGIKKVQREKLLRIIAAKKDATLEDMPLEELEKMVSA